ncbi:MAG: methyltransferase domain-containing protein [Pseudomonadota bacterium]
MFDFVRKPALWTWFDEPWAKPIQAGTFYHMKTVQDLAIYSQLQSMTGKHIAEIGGGHSRVLGTLAETNHCTNVERFEGVGNGPKTVQTIEGAETVDAYLGDHDPRLEAGRFDVVFSISVVEHIPLANLDAFFDDGMRILKPGGLWLHAIDMYLGETPMPAASRLFEVYRSWAQREGVCEPVGDIFDGEPVFRCDMATNPDNIMHLWGKSVPALNERRQQAQGCAILVGARKL